METPSSFHFSSTKSFQLFTQGLESLQAYERSASSTTLAAAERRFEECVSQFPQDLLPRFYYGVVKTLSGYDGLDEAITQFNVILNSKAEDLVPDTIYNLAVAHIEKYKPKDAKIALNLLERTREEISKRPSEPKLESLGLQALILEIYLFVEANLWEHRGEEEKPAEELFQKAKSRLDDFWSKYKQAQILEASRSDLVADYHNTLGTYLESCAYFTQGYEREVLSSRAARAFEQALQAKDNWIPAKSNLARVFQDLLDEPETALHLWQEVLETRPRDEYAFYMLGRLYQHRHDKLRAVASYTKAPHIPEANLNLSLLYLELGELERARTFVQKVIEADDVRPRTRQHAEKALRKIGASSQGPTRA